MGTQRPSTHVHQPSTRDCHNDYHVGTKRRRTRNGSSSSSHHGPGAISLDRLRELAGAPEAISAGGGSKHQASRGTSTGTAPGVTLQPGELEKIMKNVEFGRQLFAELIGPFSTLQGMKDEAEDDKERAEEQLSEANERIRELQSRVISSPLPSSWMSGNVGAATSDTRLVRRLHQLKLSRHHPLTILEYVDCDAPLDASSRSGASTGATGHGNMSASLAADEPLRSVGWSLALEPVLDAVDSKLASFGIPIHSI
ncbi:unnamed protein product [Tilletia controversa]|nr:unnamed protein product [Tilletia controversa]